MLELPRLPTALPSEARGASSYHTDTSTNSLPSFATFQKRSKVANDDVDGPEIAPMSSRLSCDTCITLKPLLQQTALAFGEIDEIVQACCNRPGQRVCRPVSHGRSLSPAIDIDQDIALIHA